MGDMANYIAMAIPVFFLLIGIELWWAKREEREVARLNDAVADISTGTVQQIVGRFAKASLFAAYALIWQHWRLFEVSASSAWAWVVGFLGVDFFYYWFHRFSHESNFAWAAHVVHHQSEDYNLSVALRQSALQQFISAPFYWPLALVGFPPAMFLTLSAANTLYQFWIHTEAIGRLGLLETFLNTPSHHRVHHGSNPQYIDRNHGGTLIVWDRLFGTFEPEGERVAYGVTKPPKSWNPLWVNFHQWRELWRLARNAPRWRDKLLVWIRDPGWLPPGVEEEPRTDIALYGDRYDAHASKPLGYYLLAHFFLLMGVSFVYIRQFDDLALEWKLALAFFQIWSVVNFSGISERRRWLTASEGARLLAAVALARLWPLPVAGLAGVFVLVIASGTWLFRHRQGPAPRAESAAG
jgi:sterol desaturase/sphingolipid hydroxylase (fatty acid hydroxylase superfamily)